MRVATMRDWALRGGGTGAVRCCLLKFRSMRSTLHAGWCRTRDANRDDIHKLFNNKQLHQSIRLLAALRQASRSRAGRAHPGSDSGRSGAAEGASPDQPGTSVESSSPAPGARIGAGATVRCATTPSAATPSAAAPSAGSRCAAGSGTSAGCTRERAGRAPARRPGACRDGCRRLRMAVSAGCGAAALRRADDDLDDRRRRVGQW